MKKIFSTLFILFVVFIQCYAVPDLSYWSVYSNYLQNGKIKCYSGGPSGFIATTTFSRGMTGSSYEEVKIECLLVINNGGVETPISSVITVTSNNFLSAFGTPTYNAIVDINAEIPESKIGGTVQLKWRYWQYDYTPEPIWRNYQYSGTTYQTINVSTNPGVSLELPAAWKSRAILMPSSYSPPVASSTINTSPNAVLSTRNGNTTIYSGNGLYRLVMQDDGNLVLYNSSGTGLWHSATYTSDNSYYYELIFQTDANLVIRRYHKVSGAASDIWSSKTNPPPTSTDASNAIYAYLALQDDGNLAMYWHHPQTISGSGYYSLEYSTKTHGGQMSPIPGKFF